VLGVRRYPTRALQPERAEESGAQVKTDADQVEEFLKWIFKPHPLYTKTSESPRVVLTRKIPKPNGQTRLLSESFKRSEFFNAASFADTTHDVYFRQTTIGYDVWPGTRRSNAAESLTGGHLWADVDFQDPSHVAGNLPADADAALAIVDAVLRPSAVIHSGGGIYPIWRLTDYVDLTTADRRARFQGVNVSITEALKQFRIHVDNVSSPDRILRPVGTVNRKRPDDLRRVTWLRHPDDGAGDFTFAHLAEKFPPVIRVQQVEDNFLKRERHPIGSCDPWEPSTENDPTIFDVSRGCATPTTGRATSLMRRSKRSSHR